MNPLELHAQTAAALDRLISITSDVLERKGYQLLAAEHRRRHREALAAARPALVFRLVRYGVYDVGVQGRPLNRLHCDLHGAMLAWSAIAHTNRPELSASDLLAAPTDGWADDSARRAIKTTFLNRLRRLGQTELADALAGAIRVLGGVVRFEPGPMTPKIIFD